MIEGVVPVIPTPFVPKTEEIDFPSLRRLIDFASDHKFAAVCLPAYASEFYKLTEAERYEVIETAIDQANGRTAVIAQSNHPSSKVAATIARRNVELGADLVSFALPRIFALSEPDLTVYAQVICEAVEVPVLIQDFNPGGPTVGAEFCKALNDVCPNFQYVKLEEPMMGAKVRAIREATEDRVGVLEGWGGLYVLELLSSGICGLMPGLGIADLLAKIWRRGHAGRIEEAFDIFNVILPQLVFSLQNMELFLLVEKRLLVERGVLQHAVTRSAGLTLSPEMSTYTDQLNQRVIQALDAN